MRQAENCVGESPMLHMRRGGIQRIPPLRIFSQGDSNRALAKEQAQEGKSDRCVGAVKKVPCKAGNQSLHGKRLPVSSFFLARVLFLGSDSVINLFLRMVKLPNITFRAGFPALLFI